MEIPYVVNPRKDTGLFNSKIAIWLFLASEVMLFGGLFSGYIFLRLGADYPWPERSLPVVPGLINTFILIASSVTVVFAWAALKMRQWGRFQVFMGITVLCAAVFMVLKGIEYNVKFHHQAVRLDDYAMVEGHAGYVKKGGAGHDDHGEDHGEDHGDHGEADYLLDADGHKIEKNHYVFETTALTLDLRRAYLPWVEDVLEAAEAQGVTVELAEALDFNAPGESEEKKIVPAGEALSVSTVKKLKKLQDKNHAANASWRTRFLREAWDEQWEKVEQEDLLGEAAFSADYPKALQLPSDERELAFTRWRAVQRVSFASNVDPMGVSLKKSGEMVQYADVELPEFPTAKFTTSGPLTLRHTSHDVISAYAPDAGSISLRDGTTLEGGYGDSSLELHYLDAIDLRHLVMVAEEKGLDPEKAIDGSWLMRENPDIAGIWEKHRKAVGQLEQELAKKDRVPTHKDRYRIDWPSMVYYVDTPLEEVQVEEDGNAVPKVKPTPKEIFMGPDYEHRDFPHLTIPREHVMLDSKFTPKWNTYYAIYFTITGLHGLHVIGGAIVLGYYLFCSKKLYLKNPEWLANRVEVGGLFWHFVDLVWIFAFPIFYLM